MTLLIYWYLDELIGRHSMHLLRRTYYYIEIKQYMIYFHQIPHTYTHRKRENSKLPAPLTKSAQSSIIETYNESIISPSPYIIIYFTVTFDFY